MSDKEELVTAGSYLGISSKAVEAFSRGWESREHGTRRERTVAGLAAAVPYLLPRGYAPSGIQDGPPESLKHEQPEDDPLVTGISRRLTAEERAVGQIFTEAGRKRMAGFIEVGPHLVRAASIEGVREYLGVGSETRVTVMTANREYDTPGTRIEILQALRKVIS